MGRRPRRQFSPSPKIFAGAYARLETGMDFGLAFIVPNGQCGVNSRVQANISLQILVETDILFIFFEFLRKVF